MAEERFVTRGFVGRRDSGTDGEGLGGDERRRRTPPGQYLTTDFPVLSAGPTPRTPLDRWSLRLDGLVDRPLEWSWQELLALPSREYVVDISCVTKWTHLDMRWKGVSVDTLLEGVGLDPRAAFVIAMCDGGYTTNLPLGDVLNNQAFIAYEYDGRAARARARRAGSPRGARALLLEEREVGPRPPDPGSRRARLLGIARLPQPRRPVA